MRLLEDGLINRRNCHDMPAVIPKMLNLFEMEIGASTVALAFPDIYPRLGLNCSWNILTGSIRRKNPTNQNLGYPGRLPSHNPLNLRLTQHLHHQADNKCLYLLHKIIQTDKFFEMLQVLTSVSIRNRIKPRFCCYFPPPHCLCGYVFLHTHEIPWRHSLNMRLFSSSVHHSLLEKALLREVWKSHWRGLDENLIVLLLASCSHWLFLNFSDQELNPSPGSQPSAL